MVLFFQLWTWKRNDWLGVRRGYGFCSAIILLCSAPALLVFNGENYPIFGISLYEKSLELSFFSYSALEVWVHVSLDDYIRLYEIGLIHFIGGWNLQMFSFFLYPGSLVQISKQGWTKIFVHGGMVHAFLKPLMLLKYRHVILKDHSGTIKPAPCRTWCLYISSRLPPLLLFGYIVLSCVFMQWMEGCQVFLAVFPSLFGWVIDKILNMLQQSFKFAYTALIF